MLLTKGPIAPGYIDSYVQIKRKVPTRYAHNYFYRVTFNEAVVPMPMVIHYNAAI